MTEPNTKSAPAPGAPNKFAIATVRTAEIMGADTCTEHDLLGYAEVPASGF